MNTVSEPKLNRAASRGGIVGAHPGSTLDTVRSEMATYSHPSERIAFATTWLRSMAYSLEHAWPPIYELLAIVRDEKLYEGYFAERDYGQTFGSFREFFEHVMGQPWERWAELEATYHFVRDNAPGLLDRGLSEATAAVAKAREQAATVKPGAPKGNRNAAKEPEAEATPETKRDGITNCLPHKRHGGTSRSYWYRRLARLDRDTGSDWLDRVEAGEFTDPQGKPSAAAAARAAGIRKPDRRILLNEDPAKAAAQLRERFGEDFARALGEELLK